MSRQKIFESYQRDYACYSSEVEERLHVETVMPPLPAYQ